MRLATLILWTFASTLAACAGRSREPAATAPSTPEAAREASAGFGELTWAARRYGTLGYEELTALAAAEDGGIFGVGWIRAAHPGETMEHRDIWIVRLDRDGRVLWQKAYGGKSSFDPSAVAPTRDGGCVVVGTGTALGSTGFVLRVDASGGLVWERFISNPPAKGKRAVRLESFVQATDVVADAEGGFLVAGVDFGYWVMRFDADGQPGWARAYVDGGRPEHVAMAGTGDGGVVLAGTGPDGGIAMRLAKDGGIGWERQLPAAASVWDVSATSDGSYVVAGSIATGGADGTSTSVDAWLLTLDENGGSQGALALDAGASEVALAVLELAGVGLVVAGTYRADPEPATDAVLFALTPERRLDWQLRFGASRLWEEARALAAHPQGGVVAVGNQGIDALILDVGPDGQLEHPLAAELGGELRSVEHATAPAKLHVYVWEPVVTAGESAAVDTRAEASMADQR